MNKNQEKIQAALERIEEGLATINSDKDWIQYLQFQSKFWNYSYSNIFLIMLQRPNATYVRGYKAWNKLGRFVRKGEKGIGILCPCIRKVETFAEPDEVNVYNDKEAEKQVKKVISGFRVGYVYDISQTDGSDEQIPVLVKGLAGDTEQERAIYEALYSHVSKEYCLQEATGMSAKGSYNLETHQITISADLEPRQKIKSLLHELSHAKDFAMHPEDSIPRNKRELIAESCAYVVCLRLGIDTSSYSFSYLRSWLKDPQELKDIANCVQKVSAQIINNLAGSSDSAFSDLREESEDKDNE